MNVQAHEHLLHQRLGATSRALLQDPVQEVETPLLSWLGTLPELAGLPLAASPMSEQERAAAHLLQMGQEAIAQGDWEGADHTLSRARDLRMDQPAILAALAWARLNNEAMPVDVRTTDALALARLALQLAPEDPEVAALVAAVLQRDGADAGRRQASAA